MKADFYGTIDVRPIDGRVWEYQGEWGIVVSTKKTSLKRRIEPFDGFRCDLCSIPRIAWRLIGPPAGFSKKSNYLAAGVIHDLLYVFGTEPGLYHCSRKYADDVFLACLKDLGVSKWRRAMMYSCVRVFGGRYFGDKERLSKLRGVDYE